MLTKQELEVLTLNTQPIRSIAVTLKRSKKQVYRIAKSLEAKGFIERSRHHITPTKNTQSSLLLALLRKHPQLKPLLADSGIPILANLPNSVAAIVQNTGIKKSTVYAKLRVAARMSIVHKGVLNTKLWPDLQELLEELKRYNNAIDARVPVGSVIYLKNAKEILFATDQEQTAEITGFSAYGTYGIKLLLPVRYYYLPKRPLTKKEVFLHSLSITQKEPSVRHLTFLALFYLKHNVHISHPIIENIKAILKGKRIAGYPTGEEIRERATLYGIRVDSAY